YNIEFFSRSFRIALVFALIFSIFEVVQGHLNGGEVAVTQPTKLAAHEMHVGRWYMKRGEHLAAINRFRVVVTDYPRTAHVEEALMRLTECYYTLGIANEAQTAAAVLGHNFPNSKWYKDAYALLTSKGLQPHEHSGSWISRAWRATFSSSKRK
ncbi:MAG: outer membrane protein assembly factor BamD, partial [Alphaproteobacteria bacterium]